MLIWIVVMLFILALVAFGLVGAMITYPVLRGGCSACYVR